jgi:antitoxin ParD1/3/4
MNVSLTPQLERLVKKKVKSGAYHSASEVVREALRLFDERERLREFRLAELREQIEFGVEQIERGEVTSVPIDEIPQYMESLRKRAKARLKAPRKKRR